MAALKLDENFSPYLVVKSKTGTKMQPTNPPNLIIYNTADGKASVSLLAKDGQVWMNQNQLAELFDTSKQNIGQHIANILEESELGADSVVKNFFTTASDGKDYEVMFYALDMILAIGFRVRSKRGTQFRIWANRNLKEYMVKGWCWFHQSRHYGRKSVGDIRPVRNPAKSIGSIQRRQRRFGGN
jgi:hypothetical protein